MIINKEKNAYLDVYDLPEKSISTTILNDKFSIDEIMQNFTTDEDNQDNQDNQDTKKTTKLNIKLILK